MVAGISGYFFSDKIKVIVDADKTTGAAQVQSCRHDRKQASRYAGKRHRAFWFMRPSEECYYFTNPRDISEHCYGLCRTAVTTLNKKNSPGWMSFYIFGLFTICSLISILLKLNQLGGFHACALP